MSANAALSVLYSQVPISRCFLECVVCSPMSELPTALGRCMLWITDWTFRRRKVLSRASRLYGADWTFLPRKVQSNAMDQSLFPSASHASAVRNAIFGDFFWLLGLPEASPWRHRLMPLLQPVVGRFADLAAEFDQTVAQVGLAPAIRPYYSRFAERVTVTGTETLPAAGPLLVVSNHPGAYDLFLILSNLPRDDVKVIVSEISILHRLPAFDRYFISIGPSASNSVSAAKAGVRHLQAGGALFLFPGGIVDPDPAFMPGAVESLERWLSLIHISEPTRPY